MDVLRFDFLDRPKESALKDALKQLYVLDAIDENGKITKIGKEMSPLPLEPNLARAMLEAKKLGCVEECATIAAMLSVDRLEVADSSSHSKSREYRGNPLQKIVSEDAFALGDHIVFLRTFERWQRERYRRDFAREYSLSERGLEFAKDVRRQLLDSLRSLEDDNDVGLSKRSRGKEEKREEEEEEQQQQERHGKNKSERSRTKNVRKALAKGFISKIARRGTASNCFKTFAFETKTLTEVHPSCARALADEDGLLPDWIVYHEMIMTSRPFLRHVCKVEYEWIEDALPRLESPIDVKKLSGGFYENERDFSSGGGPENGDTAANATNAQEDKTQQKVKQEEKVNEARARFLARKKMKAGAK
jgi:ATP-dependent RNA helicase DHX8/PRP22